MAYLNDALVKIYNYVSPLIEANLTTDRLTGRVKAVTDRINRTNTYTFENPCELGTIYGVTYGYMQSFTFNNRQQNKINLIPPERGDIIVYIHCKTPSTILLHDGQRFIGYADPTSNLPTGNVENMRGLRINGEDVDISTLTAAKFSDLIYNKPSIIAVRNVPFNLATWWFSGYEDPNTGARNFDFIGELGDAIVTWQAMSDDEVQLGEGWLAETYGIVDLLPAKHPYRGGVELEPNPAASKSEEMIFKVHRFSVDHRPDLLLDGTAISYQNNIATNTGEKIVQLRGERGNYNPMVTFWSRLIEKDEDLANLVYSERFFQMEDDVKSIKEQFKKFETDYPLQIEKINNTSVAMEAKITAALDDYNATVNANFQTLSQQLADFQATLTASINDFKTEIRTEMANFKTEMNGNLDAFKTEVRTDIANFKTEVNNTIETYKNDIITEMTDCRAEIAEARADIKTTVDGIKDLKTLIYAGV
jgi:hypothetical protein